MKSLVNKCKVKLTTAVGTLEIYVWHKFSVVTGFTTKQLSTTKKTANNYMQSILRRPIHNSQFAKSRWGPYQGTTVKHTILYGIAHLDVPKLEIGHELLVFMTNTTSKVSDSNVGLLAVSKTTLRNQNMTHILPFTMYVSFSCHFI
jgi:hypothetical protein